MTLSVTSTEFDSKQFSEIVEANKLQDDIYVESEAFHFELALEKAKIMNKFYHDGYEAIVAKNLSRLSMGLSIIKDRKTFTANVLKSKNLGCGKECLLKICHLS